MDAVNQVDVQQVHPDHLHAISTSHKWALGAIAELIDNAQDPGVDASEISIDIEKICGKTCLTFVDNGLGMDLKGLTKMLSFGYCDKKKEKDKFKSTEKPIGQYGNGFKSGSMRLAKDAMVLTVSQESQAACVGLLSQTMCFERGLDKVVIPMIKYTLPDLQPCPEAEQSSKKFSQSLDLILEFSPYHREEELKEEFKKLMQQKPPRNIKRQRGQKGSGTKIVLYNLKMNKGMLELDFHSDDKDIRDPQTQDESDVQQKTKVLEYKQSLRRYCSILYQKPKMTINIRKKKVNTCFLKSTLTRLKKYLYKPKGREVKCEITFGIPKSHSTVEDFGVMIYHRNRLITPYKKLGCQLKADGPGIKVLGVVDVSDVLTPTHNKQDFNEDSSAKRSALQVFSSKLDAYCGIGEQVDPSKGQTNNPWDWVMCNKCTKWRRLPEFAGKKFPNKWYCKNNPDQARNRCEIPEQELDVDEYDLPCSTSAKQQGDQAKATTSENDVFPSTSKASVSGKTTKESPARVAPAAGNSTKETSAKKQVKKINNAATDIIILKEVVKQNPYRDATAWDIVAANLAKIDGRFLDVKKVISKTKTLRQAFKKGEIQKRKGTPQELSEIVKLIQNLEGLAANAPNIARRKRKKSEEEGSACDSSCAYVSSSSPEVLSGPSTSKLAKGEGNKFTPIISKKTQISLIQAAVKQVSPFLPQTQTVAGSFAVGADTTVPSPKKPRLSESLIKRAFPIFSQKWRMKHFRSEGGELAWAKSDVALTVPEDAVLGTTVEIRGAVSTDLDKVYRKFLLADSWKNKNESIVSPVAEYNVYGPEKFAFREPVIVSLPHFLPPSFDPDKVRVYRFYRQENSAFRCQRLFSISDPVRLKRKLGKRGPNQSDKGVSQAGGREGEETQGEKEAPAGFCFSDLRRHKEVQILTCGLSGYFMTYTYTDTRSVPSHIALRLYARYGQHDTPHVDVMLLVWDLRLKIRDFREMALPEESMREMEYQGSLLLELCSGLDPAQVELKLSLHTEPHSWTHKVIMDGKPHFPETQTFPLRKFCQRLSEPVHVHWSLQNSSLAPFRGYVSAGYTMNNDSLPLLEQQTLPIWLENVTATMKATTASKKVEQKSANLHQQNAFIQEKQSTTQHKIFTSDDDGHNEVSNVRRPSSCSIHSNLDCSDESSSDEDSRPYVYQANVGGTSFETTDPASSMFCHKWEVSGVFGSEGGLLEKPDSDVQLLVPPGAIKSGSKVTVHAAVKADLEHLYEKLEGKLKKEEVIVSPVAEYWVGKDWKFEKPVTIILPHLLPSIFIAEEVRVYHITRDQKGGFSLSAIPNRDSLGLKEGGSQSSSGSFRISRDFVTVQTDHFSAVLCTHSTKRRKVKRHPELFIRGCGTFADCGPCQAITLSVLIWDKRLHSQDFMMQEHGIRIREYQEPLFIRASSELKERLKLQVPSNPNYPEIRHCQDTEGRAISQEEMIFDLTNKFGCQKCINKGKYSIIQHQWHMELPPNSLQIEAIRIHVRVIMEPNVSDEDETSVSFMLNKNLSSRNVAGIQAEQIAPSDENATYEYVNKNLVLAVAKALGTSGSKTFFLDLGLSDNQFEEINVRNMSLCDKNFELIKTWCQSQQARNEGALPFLKESLENYGRRDLAEKVEQFQIL